jgi:hypothetical protein
MPPVDVHQHLRAQTERAHRLLSNDIKAIAEDKNNVCPGGCARPALNIVAECAAINGMVAGFFRTGEFTRLTPEQREKHLSTFDTVEKALSYLDQETARLQEVLASLDVDTLGDTTEKFFGRTMTLFQIAELPSTHMMYHDGQLNYIQTLHGDSEMHWG